MISFPFFASFYANIKYDFFEELLLWNWFEDILL